MFPPVHVVSTFRRRLSTSRQYVFENIMDLEHVCALHRRWFRNLRVRVARPDYVEYKLTSLFYGLKQELLVRGGPIDRDRYWYEFLGPIAHIRVDGMLEGPDGDLTQTEKITYKFHWAFAPAFWLLRPLFRRQKLDILRDDSALLERVYALERSGFKRYEPAQAKVVVYGGTGFFGRLVVEDLLTHTDARIVVASRHPDTRLFSGHRGRVTFAESDLKDYGSIRETIRGATVAVGCNGPFQGAAPTLLKACIEARVHYVDVADDRGFVERALKLHPEAANAEIVALVGCSVVPGLSALMTQYCRDWIPQVERVRIFITPGTRHPRGPGSFYCLLATVGTEFTAPVNGTTRNVIGWTERERVEFPPPIGTRFVYSVVDIADYLIQPLYFNAKTVEFKIGAEFDFLNRALAFVRWTKQTLHIRDLGWLARVARALISATAVLGTTRGAVMVEVSGSHEGVPVGLISSVFAVHQGEIIPALLPSIATAMILRNELRCRGIPPPHWISSERMVHELAKRDVEIVAKHKDSREWISWNEFAVR